MMSIATELNITCTPTNDDDYGDIQKLSLALQFWSTNRMKYYFQKWNKYTINKLNILYIKYNNYKYIRDKKTLFYCLKKWQLLQQNNQSIITSITHWANNQQTNHFKQWKSIYKYI